MNQKRIQNKVIQHQNRGDSQNVRDDFQSGMDKMSSYTAAANAEHVACAAYQIVEPPTMDEALAGYHSTKWKEAADIEYRLLIENETWDPVELPSGRTPIGSKWVFKVKHKSDGTVERFKARLVAKGYAHAVTRH